MTSPSVNERVPPISAGYNEQRPSDRVAATMSRPRRTRRSDPPASVSSSSVSDSSDVDDSISPSPAASLTSSDSLVSAASSSTAANVFLFLVAFRLLNALSIRTFFQPDEFFQSLEPAWQIAFGKDQGAWITWVSGKEQNKGARPSRDRTPTSFIIPRGSLINDMTNRNGGIS